MESQSPLHVVRVRESFVEGLLNFYTDLRICQKRIISLKMSWERLRWCCGGDVSGVHCLECSYYTSLPRFLLFQYFSFLALKLGSFFSMFFVCGGKLEVWTFFLLPNIKNSICVLVSCRVHEEAAYALALVPSLSYFFMVPPDILMMPISHMDTTAIFTKDSCMFQGFVPLIRFFQWNDFWFKIWITLP